MNQFILREYVKRNAKRNTIEAVDPIDGRRWRWDVPEGAYSLHSEVHPPEPLALVDEDGTIIMIDPVLVAGQRP